MKDTKEKITQEIDSTKREFMKKFGGYAATAPIGMFMLMSPNASANISSGGSGSSPRQHP